jgi:two-component system, NarL family, response regulator NreC
MTIMPEIKIIIADDHNMVRQGLRVLLEAEPGFSVVGEAADGLNAIELVRRLAPDVLVVDLVMPGVNGMEVVRQVKGFSRNTQVVVLSMHANEAYVTEVFKNGAMAYVLKESRAADLIYAIREAVSGRYFMSPPLSRRAVDIYIKKAVEDTSLDPYDTLTNREREVFQLAAEGYSNAEIGARMFISPRTAETHRAHLMHKLDLHSQTDLVRYAFKKGLLITDA